MGKKIIALKILAGELHVDPVEIDDELKTYQEYVGGCIECCTLDKRWLMIVNDNGLNEGLPFNELATIVYNAELELDNGSYVPIVGNAIIVGRDGENFTSAPMDIILYIIRLAELHRTLVNLFAPEDEEAKEELLQ